LQAFQIKPFITSPNNWGRLNALAKEILVFSIKTGWL